jgi:hypothetical protein
MFHVQQPTRSEEPHPGDRLATQGGRRRFTCNGSCRAAAVPRQAGHNAGPGVTAPEMIASAARPAMIAASGELTVRPEKGLRMLEFTLVSAVQPGA